MPSRSFRQKESVCCEFYFLNQIFVVNVQKAGLSTVSVSALTLLIVATGLITYYVNLRTIF